MKSKFILAAVAIAVAAPAVPLEPAFARHARTHVYQRDRSDYRYRCRGSKGTTGLLAGGAGGALIGHEVGGGVLGTVAGGVGGALLGRHIDKKTHQARNRRRGC
ncbi:MAG: glycine zipper 2TM domain-containing protein [Novosphingobium sp.]